MTRGRKTAREINEQKWRRMRLILDKLRENAMSVNEIEKLVSGKSPVDNIVKRSVQNYVAELIALGLVHYNSEAGVYQLAEIKRVFGSKHDYDVALRHSKNLLLSTREKQRLDRMKPLSALDLLVFYGTSSYRDFWGTSTSQDVDDKCLLQHIRTGYFELYSLMQKYRKTMEETGFAQAQRFAKISDSIDLDGLEPMESKPAEGRRMKELYDLIDLAVGKLYRIVDDVKNGIPLQGYCDHCPDRRVTIKDKS